MKHMLTRLRLNARVGTVARVLIWLAVGMLLATPPLHDWPVEVGVYANSDTTVVVTWESREQGHVGGCGGPDPAPYDSFELLFQPVGDSSWTVVGRTRDTFMAHDPQHRVGRYSVRGWRGSDVNWHAEEFYATTEPRHIGPVRLHEVSTGDTSALAFGSLWDPPRVFVIDTALVWAGQTDVYVTDYKDGSPGPMLIASPSLVSGDPGVRVADYAHGRATWFSLPLAEEPPLSPVWEPFTWVQICSLPHVPFIVACRQVEDNYALIKVRSLGSASIELEVWYQQINGLRLIGH